MAKPHLYKTRDIKAFDGRVLAPGMWCCNVLYGGMRLWGDGKTPQEAYSSLCKNSTFEAR